MAKKSKFKLGDKVTSTKWPGEQFEIVLEIDNRFAIQSKRIRAIATQPELTLIKE